MKKIGVFALKLAFVAMSLASFSQTAVSKSAGLGSANASRGSLVIQGEADTQDVHDYPLPPIAPTEDLDDGVSAARALISLTDDLDMLVDLPESAYLAP